MARYKQKLWQLLIALDQLVNVVVSLLLPWSAIGWADETITARAWRLEQYSAWWRSARVVIDWIFTILSFGKERDHCQNSHLSEQVRARLPAVYRALKQTRSN